MARQQIIHSMKRFTALLGSVAVIALCVRAVTYGFGLMNEADDTKLFAGLMCVLVSSGIAVAAAINFFRRLIA